MHRRIPVGYFESRTGIRVHPAGWSGKQGAENGHYTFEQDVFYMTATAGGSQVTQSFVLENSGAQSLSIHPLTSASSWLGASIPNTIIGDSATPLTGSDCCVLTADPLDLSTGSYWAVLTLVYDKTLERTIFVNLSVQG